MSNHRNRHRRAAAREAKAPNTGLRRTRICGVGLFLLTLTLAGAAAAQTDSERATARAAAEAGDAAFKEGRYEEAVDYFSRAESILHAPTLLLHVARAQAKLGRYVLSREAYIKVKLEALGPDAPAAFRAAQESARRELEDVERKLARLTLKVEGPARDHVRASLNGQPLSTALIGLPFASDPGSHVLEVSADGYDSQKLEVSLKEGGSQELVVTLTPALGAAPASPSPAAAAAPDTAEASTQYGSAETDSTSADAGGALRTGAYVAFGVGVVGVGLGTLFLVQRGNSQSEADAAFDACAAGGSSCNDRGAIDRIADLDDEAASQGTLAVVSYVAGGVGLATGVALYLLSGSERTSQEARVTPRVAPYFAGTTAGVVGRF